MTKQHKRHRGGWGPETQASKSFRVPKCLKLPTPMRRWALRPQQVPEVGCEILDLFLASRARQIPGGRYKANMVKFSGEYRVLLTPSWSVSRLHGPWCTWMLDSKLWGSFFSFSAPCACGGTRRRSFAFSFPFGGWREAVVQVFSRGQFCWGRDYGRRHRRPAPTVLQRKAR